METKLFEIINYIRSNKDLQPLLTINKSDRLREELGFSSFDLAELTVRVEDEFDIDIFEDGLISTIDEILMKLTK